MGHRADRRRVLRVREARVDLRADTLAVEEPLEIRVNGTAYTITMRTPGDDFALAAGHLVSEGTVRQIDDIRGIRHCEDGVSGTADNVVDVTLDPGVAPPTSHRHSYMSSACGICGKDSLDAVRTRAAWDLTEDDATLSAELVSLMPERLREGQTVFQRTGGLHAAGLFTREGELLHLAEDVGRHNAVDKVVGLALMAGRLPARGTVLQVSGRASYELVQKAWMAGVPALSAVSAPSTLAVDLAVEAGMTLAGFVRGVDMNVYAGAWRMVDVSDVPDP